MLSLEEQIPNLSPWTKAGQAKGPHWPGAGSRASSGNLTLTAFPSFLAGTGTAGTQIWVGSGMAGEASLCHNTVYHCHIMSHHSPGNSSHGTLSTEGLGGRASQPC